MKILIATLIALTCFNAFAKKNSYKDISSHTTDSPKPHLTRTEILDRLSIKAVVYVTSPDGTQLFNKSAESRMWGMSGQEHFEGLWISDSDSYGNIAIKQKWSLNKKNQLVANIEQYTTIDNKDKTEPPKLGKMTNKMEKVIKNFSPLTVTLNENRKQKTVIIYTPELMKKEDPAQDAGDFKIAVDSAVAVDNKGNIWFNEITFSGKFLSLKTHQGTIKMSFFPFKGAKEIGYAKDGLIKLKITKKHKVTLLSALPITPFNKKFKVYGNVDLKKRSKKLRSINIISSSDAKEFEG